MSVLPLADAKEHLNITSATHDAELQKHIVAAEALIGRRCGPLEGSAKTKRVTGGGRLALPLPISPVISLTTVTGYSVGSVNLADLYLNQDAGVVTYNSGTPFTDRYYDISYQAGRLIVEGDLLQGVKEMVRHLWESQRGGSFRPGQPEMDHTANTVPNVGDELPFQVMVLIASELRDGLG